MCSCNPSKASANRAGMGLPVSRDSVASRPFCAGVSSKGVCSRRLLYQENQPCATAWLPPQSRKPCGIGRRVHDGVLHVPVTQRVVHEPHGGAHRLSNSARTLSSATCRRRHPTRIHATDNAWHRRTISAFSATMASSSVAHSSVSRRWASPTSALVHK